MEVNKEKIRYILQFFFDKGENASQMAEIVSGVYGVDTAIANYVQFWFRRFCSGIFYVKVAPRPANSDIFCEQLDRLKLVTDQKRPELANRRGVVFHQDNVTPHTSSDSPETLGAWLESFNVSTI
ncbi:histone-lysine N-methyltransferase SETMAR [Trichonephila clavipes]|nr:histone-lysine N-methyltransferase SETMAR [Trichonephila clavipes]